jgi:hypothetical protein
MVVLFLKRVAIFTIKLKQFFSALIVKLACINAINYDARL